MRWMWCVLASSCWKCTFRWSTTVGIHLANFTHPVAKRLWKVKPSTIFVQWHIFTEPSLCLSRFPSNITGCISSLNSMTLQYLVVHSSCLSSSFLSPSLLSSIWTELTGSSGWWKNLPVCSVMIHFQYLMMTDLKFQH